MAEGSIAETKLDVARQRAKILEPIANGFGCSREVARAAGDALGLSPRQVYKLVARLRAANGDIAVLLPKQNGYGQALKRSIISKNDLQRVIDEIADQTIANEPIAPMVRRVIERCRVLGLGAPSPSTVRRRLIARSGLAGGTITDPPTSLSASPILTGRLPITRDESLLELLYRTVGNPEGWQQFVDALGESYGSGFGNLVFHDFKRGFGSVEATGGKDASHFASYNSYYAPLNPWLSSVAQTPVGIALSTEHMITRSEFLSSEFIQDWCRPQGIGGGVVVTIQRDESRIMAVSSFFSAATFEREPDVTGRLQRLAPHLLRVAQLNRQFASLEARTAAAEGALERLATAMLVLNADGQVIYLNQQADRIMAAADGITIRSGKLEIYKSEESRALRGLIASAAASQSNIRSQPGGVMAITRRSGHGRYEVLAAPISDTTIRFGFSGPLVVVFIRQPDSTMTTPMEWLRQIYGLTAAEGRLMQALVAGDSLDGAASRFSVTRETVRSQLKAVFQKTGAASQGDLIRLGMRSLAATFR